MKHLPNILSLLRMVGAVVLLLCDVVGTTLALPSSVTTRPSPSELGWLSLLRPFWVLYALCGFSDIADGWLARKLKCTTRTGALLDSMADICFVACCAWKLLSMLELPQWLWLWAGAIVAIKYGRRRSEDRLSRLLFRAHGQHRGVPRHPDALYEARLLHVYLLSRTDGRTETNARSDGDRLLQAHRKVSAQKDSQR